MSEIKIPNGKAIDLTKEQKDVNARSAALSKMSTEERVNQFVDTMAQGAELDKKFDVTAKTE